jgi:hypothetical protein
MRPLSPDRRAGLVGTNSISQNRARSVSLEYIIANGGVITDAVSTQDWPGEAVVDVSLVNWIKRPSSPPTKFILDGEPVDNISAELRTSGHSTGVVAVLSANKGRCFQGPTPSGRGFIISRNEAENLLGIGKKYRDVVRPYLGSADIARESSQAASRWAIDFGMMPLEAAMNYPAALAIIRERVKLERETNNRELYRRHWWQFAEPRPGLRRAVRQLNRCIVMGAHGKRILFVWQDTWTLASNATHVFAFDDDYALGILSSSAHSAWARSRSSTLEARLRYTPSSVFETFAWPYPISGEQRGYIAGLSRDVIKRRQEICAERDFGLTVLYNLVGDGAYEDLKNLHTKLDEAVAMAYGWPKTTAHDADEMVRLLLKLNREISVGTRRYDPFDAQATGMDELPLLGIL